MSGKTIVVLSGICMVLAACSGSVKPGATGITPGATPGNSAASRSVAAAGSAPKDLGYALNLTVGTDTKASVFASYHVELTLDFPKANDN